MVDVFVTKVVSAPIVTLEPDTVMGRSFAARVVPASVLYDQTYVLPTATRPELRPSRL